MAREGLHFEDDKDAQRILKVLAEAPQDEIGEAWVSGQDLQKVLGLSSEAINSAIKRLQNSSLVECNPPTYGDQGFDFHNVRITHKGRFELRRMTKSEPLGEFFISYSSKDKKLARRIKELLGLFRVISTKYLRKFGFISAYNFCFVPRCILFQ